MDFMHNTLANGQTFRTFNVLDVFSRECLCVAPKTSFTSAAVTDLLDAVIVKRGRPAAITCDNECEFTSRHFDAWAYEQQVAIDFIAPGKPVHNGYIESFNARLREECMSANWFTSLEHAASTLAAWIRDYNEVRPHSVLANLGPLEYIALSQAHRCRRSFRSDNQAGA